MNFFISKILKGDKVLWGMIIILSIFSILVIYSSTGILAYKERGGNTMYYLLRRSFFIFLGLFVVWFMQEKLLTIIGNVSIILLLIGVSVLIFVLVTGSGVNNAVRWFRVGGLSIQPSEIAKFALIVFTAKTLSVYQKSKETRDKAFKQIMIATAIVCGLILPENFSTAALLGFVIFILMLIGRISVKNLSYVAGAGILLLILILILPSDLPGFHRMGTWKSRIATYFDGSEKTNDSNFQGKGAEMAIAIGGFLGKGPGNSVQRNFLPNSYNDFIYAIIIEEYGILGGLIIILAYLFIFIRTLIIVRQTDNSYYAFLAIGMALLLVFQAFFNMGVATGLLPVTGQPLSLVSMGGTSTILSSAEIGCIVGVSRYNEKLKKKKQNENI